MMGTHETVSKHPTQSLLRGPSAPGPFPSQRELLASVKMLLWRLCILVSLSQTFNSLSVPWNKLGDPSDTLQRSHYRETFFRSTPDLHCSLLWLAALAARTCENVTELINFPREKPPHMFRGCEGENSLIIAPNRFWLAHQRNQPRTENFTSLSRP